MPGYQNPFMGGQPQMGQQGQQGLPMGGGMSPMGGQQGPPSPRQGPPQQGPGGGGQPGGVPGGDPMGFNFSASPGGASQGMYAGKQKYQGAIDDLMRQLQFAQIQGANPMVIADLQMQLQQQQRSFGEWQNSEYANQMGQYSQQGLGAVGGGPGPRSQIQQNPFLQMLLLSSLGMGGGGGPQMG